MPADLTPPPAPSLVTATITADDGTRRTVDVVWQDNATAPDEFNTCFWFQNADGMPDTTQCLFAQGQYDPSGTGQRTGSVVCGQNAATVRATTTRYVDLAGDGSLMYPVQSAFSDPITLTDQSSGKPGNGKGHGKGHNQ